MDINGKFNKYGFNVISSAKGTTSDLVLNADGELQNEDEQDSDDLALYQEALPELLEFIAYLNEIAKVES